MNYTNSDISRVIDEYIHSERNRQILKRRYIDGIFGKNTKLAVMEFQSCHGLKADGIIGPKTWNLVHEITKDDIAQLKMSA